MALSSELHLKIDRLAQECHGPREALLQTLMLVQATEGRVSDEAAREVAERLQVSPADVDDMVSFYPVLSREPRGRYVIRVCHTLPCALVGGEAAAAYIASRLGIAVGQTTGDGKFTLETVECLGHCGDGPAMMINDTVHGRLTPERIDAILASLENA